jgi:diketogulonate reductase-like aldo/keto reductase
LRIGYRHIDTARAYDNEASVGRAVRDSGIAREEIYVTSKLPAEAKDYDKALEEFETTMGEIGLEYLDLYLVHAPWPWDEVGKDCREGNRQIWKAMEEFLASGRVKAIGVSNFGPEDLDSLFPACEMEPMVNHIRWFIGLDPSDTVQKCAEHDIVVEAYSPFAHGLIVNHPEIGDIAASYGVSAPQLCYPLPAAKGCGRVAQGDQDLAHQVDFEISAADIGVLDAMRDTEKHEDAMEFRWL